MNFLCDKCKQKYHVAEEKVRGRDVVRFKCKKCENVIEVRPGVDTLADDGSVAGEAPNSVAPPPAASAASPKIPAAPRAPLGSPLGAAARPSVRPPTGTGLPTAPAKLGGGALPMRQPTGTGLPAARGVSPFGGGALGAPRPATQTRLPTGPATGATASSPSVSAASAARPATQTRLPTAAASPAARPAVSASPLRSALAKQNEPAPTSAHAANALINATESGWYAGIRDLPVGPLTRAEMAARIESGDVTPDTLVWREGLDDWRPLVNVEELGALLRQSAQKISGGLLTEMGRKDSASMNKVVPIAKAPAHPEFGSDDGPDEEATRVNSLSDLLAQSANNEGAKRLASALHREPAVAPKPEAKKAAPVAAPSPPSKPTPAVAPAPAAKPAAAAVPPAAAPVAKAPAAALAAPNDPTLALGAVSPTGGSPMLSPAALASERPPERRKAGVPIGVWVLMGGVLIVGVAIGLFLRNPPAQPVAQAPATRPAPAPPPPVTRQVGAEINLAANDTAQAPALPTPAAPVEPPTPAGVDPAAQSGAARTVRATSGGGGGTAARAPTTGAGGRTLSAEQQAMLNQAFGGGGGAAPATAPVAAALRPGGGGGTSSGGGDPGLSGSARAEQINAAFNRSRVVNDCWNTALRRNPAHAREQFRVRLDVNPTGRASVTVIGANDADLARCIQQRGAARPYGAGGSLVTEQSMSLAPGD